MKTKLKSLLTWGSFNLSLSILLGAVGAHALKSRLSEKALATFKTGVDYHTIASFGFFALAIVLVTSERFSWNIRSNFTENLNKLGILFFCVNCYIYALSGVKVFALLVPIGGFSFIIGWAYLGIQLLKVNNE